MLLLAWFDLILLYTNIKYQWETPTMDFIALEFDITVFENTREKCITSNECTTFFFTFLVTASAYDCNIEILQITTEYKHWIPNVDIHYIPLKPHKLIIIWKKKPNTVLFEKDFGFTFLVFWCLGSFSWETGAAKLTKINICFAAVDSIFFTCSEEPNHLDI